MENPPEENSTTRLMKPSRMIKMHDDDAICRAQMLEKLTDVGEEVSEVIVLYLEYAPSIVNVEAIEE